jgi:hypothetical protein
LIEVDGEVEDRVLDAVRAIDGVVQAKRLMF